MILLVDVGNTRIKWLLWDGEQKRERGELVHRGVAPTTLGERCWGSLERPATVMIANVAGDAIAAALNEWIMRTWSLEARFAATSEAAFGVKNAYTNPRRLGVDRWVALIGARTVTQRSCCIIDCGTATTIDALSATGVHLGGVIFPGAGLMRNALYRNTQQIPTEQGAAVLFGTDTQDCVWGGTVHAMAGAIDRITRRMQATLGDGMCPLLTGGDAESILSHLDGNYVVDRDLIFRGLLVMARNKLKVSLDGDDMYAD